MEAGSSQQRRLEEDYRRDFSPGTISFAEYVEVWDQLTKVFRGTFDDDALSLLPQTTAKDIEDWDSITNIQLLVAVEKEFKGVKFNTGEIAGMANVGQMVKLIIERFKK